MITSVNTEELKYIMGNTPYTQNIMLVGKHGIGKSEIIKSFYESIGRKVVVFFCSQAADPGDIIGLPHLSENGSETVFSLPWWFPKDGKPVVLFMDELNRARPEILQVVMDLALNRRLAGKDLPEGSMIVSAINDGDEYQLTGLDPALVSRFNVYKFSPTVSEWIEWATEYGLDQRVVSFIATNNRYLDCEVGDDLGTLDKIPDRRAWNKVSEIMKLNPDINVSLKKMVCGIVGGDAGVRFFDYVSKSMAVTPSMVIDSMQSCVKILKSYETVRLSGFNDSLCSYANVSYGDNPNALNGKRIADGLAGYMDFLDGYDREAFAHLVTNFESMKYKKVNVLISKYPDILENRINAFVMSTGK